MPIDSCNVRTDKRETRNARPFTCCRNGKAVKRGQNGNLKAVKRQNI